MAGSKNNTPIVRGVYSFAAILFTLERIARTVSDCHILSADFINDLLKSELSAVTDPANYRVLAERLHERENVSPLSSPASTSSSPGLIMSSRSIRLGAPKAGKRSPLW